MTQHLAIACNAIAVAACLGAAALQYADRRPRLAAFFLGLAAVNGGFLAANLHAGHREAQAVHAPQGPRRPPGVNRRPPGHADAPGRSRR